MQRIHQNATDKNLYGMQRIHQSAPHNSFEEISRFYQRYLLPIHVVAHKAFTEHFHLSRSAATVCTSFQDPQPASSLSFSTVRLHVVSGLPLLRFPSGAHVSTILQSLFLSCLIIPVCPIIFHLRHFISSLSGFIRALSNSSSVLANLF